MNIFKNILLCVLVAITIFLSSQVWLTIPDFLSLAENESNTAIAKETVDVWQVIKPNKYVLYTDEKYLEMFLTNEYEYWNHAINSLSTALSNFSQSNTMLKAGEVMPKEYVLMEFDNKIPIELFLGKFGVDKASLKTKLNNITKIAFELDKTDTIYIYSDETTVIVKNPLIDNSEIFNIARNIPKEQTLEYDTNLVINGVSIPIPIEKTTKILNPVYVKSEFNINDKEKIESISKDYFGKSYDYVRRSEDIQGDVLYSYKNEKILKITSEGLLDFFDSTIEYKSTENMYEALVEALNFAVNFLNMPTDMYISKVQTIQRNGYTGYRFIFTYRLLNVPILFSKIRDSEALEVDVIGDSVLSYKRFIRNQDTDNASQMVRDDILSFKEIIGMQTNIDETSQVNTLKVIELNMIGHIKEAYLAYFDISRKRDEQLLRVAWVIKLEDKIFIFNAKTGSLLEQWQVGE